MYLVTYYDTVALTANGAQEYLEKLKSLFKFKKTQGKDTITHHATINGATHTMTMFINTDTLPAEAEDYAMTHFVTLAKATGKYKFYREV